VVLSDEDIVKFQALYKSQLGIDISKEDACERAEKLVRLVSLIYRPITPTEPEVVEARQVTSLLKPK
jgi:hypothetical protein